MAIAVTDFDQKKVSFSSGRKVVTGRYKPSGTYTSGGEDITPAIARKALGLSEVDLIIFGPLMSGDQLGFAHVAFDRVRTAASQGKIRIFNAVAPHVHSFLVKGGAAAAGTDSLSIKGTTPVTIGKEAATDATNIGGVGGGVQASAAATISTEVAAASNFSSGTFYCYYVAYGR